MLDCVRRQLRRNDLRGVEIRLAPPSQDTPHELPNITQGRRRGNEHAVVVSSIRVGAAGGLRCEVVER